jgi:hypothetical protein
VQVLAVERLDVEGGVDGFLDPIRGAGDDVAGEGQFVQERGVIGAGGGGLGGGEFCFSAGALVVELGIAGADAGPVGLAATYLELGSGEEDGGGEVGGSVRSVSESGSSSW